MGNLRKGDECELGLDGSFWRILRPFSAAFPRPDSETRHAGKVPVGVES